MSGNPKDLIESGGAGQEGGAPLPDAPATEALQELTRNVTDAVGAMQDMGDLLTEKARQLHEHESVLATRDQYGHFKPGAGFTFDPATQSYNIDALSGVETLAGNVLNDFKAEIDAPTIVHQQGLEKAVEEVNTRVAEVDADHVSKTLDDATGILPVANGGTGRNDGTVASADAAIRAESAAAADTAASAETLKGMHFNWAGSDGQPSWVWGGNDETTMNIYNPANFRVSYAATAGRVNSPTYCSYCSYCGYCSYCTYVPPPNCNCGAD